MGFFTHTTCTGVFSLFVCCFVSFVVVVVILSQFTVQLLQLDGQAFPIRLSF